MTIHAFTRMAAVKSEPNGQVRAEVDGYRNGLRLGKRIWGTVMNGQASASLPGIARVGQYAQAHGHHYYVWRVFDQHVTQSNPGAICMLFTCAVATILIASLAPEYFKLLAIVPGIACGASLLFIRNKIAQNVQLRWVQSEGAVTLTYDANGYHVSSGTCLEPTPDNQWREMPEMAF